MALPPVSVRRGVVIILLGCTLPLAWAIFAAVYYTTGFAAVQSAAMWP